MLRRLCCPELVRLYSVRSLFFIILLFLEKLYQSIPEVDKDEELICMLVALGQSVKEIAELIYFSPERVELLCASVCRKLNVTEVREMEMLMKKLLS